MNDNRPTILIVDDEPINLVILNKTLSADYSIKVAKSGDKALEIVNETTDIDLILLDINMPGGLSGFDVCTQLKETPEKKGIPIIFLTGEADAETESHCFEIGAVDFIAKPINKAVVLARIKTQLGLKKANEALHEQHNAALAEKEIVEDIILRMREWDQFDPKDINYLVSSAEKSNGDIFLSAFRPDGSQVILVGDFTGHGLPASIGNPVVSYIFYKMVESGFDYQTIFAELNSAIYKMLPVNIFMGACLIETDVNREQVKIWNAGLPDVVIVQNGEVKDRIRAQSFALGIMGSFDLDGFLTMPFEKAMKIFVFSDGIMEASKPDGEMFGVERLESLLCQLGDDFPMTNIIAQVNEFAGTSEQDDDITIIGFEKK